MRNRFTLQICGESGQGVNSLGDILAKVLKDNNYYIFGYREYPSLIKGGIAGYQINFSNKPINSASEKSDMLITMSRASFHNYLRKVRSGGRILYSFGKPILSQEEKDHISNNNLHLEECHAEQIAIDITNSKLYTNTALIAFLAKTFDLDKKITKGILLDRYGKDEETKKNNTKVFDKAYIAKGSWSKYVIPRSRKDLSKHLNINGNQATALGVLNAGCRAYYHYPMTPVTSISSVLSKYSKDYGIFVFQADDEIAAAQMTLGSYYSGTRSLTATSGGGFDLMSETISMAGITEIPFVVILGQRPGPSTGLPTWSSDSDLNVALYAGHGDFPRIVLSVSDPQDSFSLIQESFALAERYQVPVILLTDKHIGESLFLVEELKAFKKLKFALGDDSYIGPRYSYSENAVPVNTLPGRSENLTKVNSDEHDMFGNSTEDGETAIDMQERRMMKLDLIKGDLTKEIVHGDKNSKNLILSWGGTKGAIIDALNSDMLRNDISFKYIHINHIYPISNHLEDHIKSAKKVIFIEQNISGQLERLIRTEISVKTKYQLRKYDGRPFYMEEILEYLNSKIS